MTHAHDPSSAVLSPEACAAALMADRARYLGFVQRIVGDRATAEDILQEALMRGMKQVAALRSTEALSGWFYSLLRNASIDHLRRVGASERAIERAQREGATPTEHVPHEHSNVCQCVTKVVADLKPEFSQVLQHVVVEGGSVKGFAEAEGITANNAGVRIHRARKALRDKVMETCGACAGAGCTDCTCGH